MRCYSHTFPAFDQLWNSSILSVYKHTTLHILTKKLYDFYSKIYALFKFLIFTITRLFVFAFARLDYKLIFDTISKYKKAWKMVEYSRKMFTKLCVFGALTVFVFSVGFVHSINCWIGSFFWWISAFTIFLLIANYRI